MVRIMSIKSFKPYKIYKDIYVIDYESLLKNNKKYIIFDLDNTIISYSESIPDEKAVNLFNHLKELGFICIILSNNHNERLRIASETLGVPFFANAMKPFKKGYKKIIKKYNITDYNTIVTIGDQLITDVYGAQRTSIDAIFVNAIDRSGEHWYTRFNRFNENRIIKKFKKKYNDTYLEIMKIRGNDNA